MKSDLNISDAEIIDKYLTDKLSRDEVLEFSQRLHYKKGFVGELSFMQSLNEAVVRRGRDELKLKVNKYLGNPDEQTKEKSSSGIIRRLPETIQLHQLFVAIRSFAAGIVILVGMTAVLYFITFQPNHADSKRVCSSLKHYEKESR